MLVARLQDEKSVAELVARIYGLKANDPRTSAAEDALLAANPQLSNLAGLPAGTPIVVPEIMGLTVNSRVAADPLLAVWVGIMDQLFNSAQHASNAQSTGVTTKPPNPPDLQRNNALTLLQQDIAEFDKLHRT
jgi:hypothetical protein